MDKNIATKLIQLSEIQEIDIRIDEIIQLRGTLPEEVDELQRNIEKLYIKISESEYILNKLQEEIAEKKDFIKQAEKKVQRYEAQQMEVRNNREYDALTKELELQKLDIQLAQKFLRIAYEKIEQENIALEEFNHLIKGEEVDLSKKKKELEIILQASKVEQEELHTKRDRIAADLGEVLYITYERIRKSVSNKLVVVPIKKGACGGCCIVIPPQQKLEVYERTKMVFCEHCGRMLIAQDQLSDLFFCVR